MFINEKFNFDGLDSSQYGLYIVKVGGGNIQGQYGINRNIIKENIPNNPLPHFFGFELEPLTFKVQLFLDGIWTPAKKREIANWLFKDSYKPFYSYDNVDIVYNCIVVSQTDLVVTGTSEGYLEITFECDAPWAWTPTIMGTFDLSGNTGSQIIQLENKSTLLNYKHYPEVEIKLIGDATGFTLKNMSNSGKETTFSGLEIGETIYIDNQKKIIKSSISGVYRYINFNKTWLELVYGMNQIQVQGKCIIKTRSKFPVVT